MTANLEVIDAFVDGERVDPAALKDALSEAAGRDYFVDLWALRDAMQQDPDVGVDPRVPASPSVSTSRRWLVAAALVACVAGGYAAGTRSALPARVAPTPTASVPAPPVTAAAPVRGVFPAPQPTRVIQLEFHPDSARSGGN
ncbi:MAG TPA: hypothetical protein VFV98_01325 [Vicinamibacterales bacterium]|nr:hypothetical protein [Vicinamibacterales bacterium]